MQATQVVSARSRDLTVHYQARGALRPQSIHRVLRMENRRSLLGATAAVTMLLQEPERSRPEQGAGKRPGSPVAAGRLSHRTPPE
jgi:hypothetical protein